MRKIEQASKLYGSEEKGGGVHLVEQLRRFECLGAALQIRQRLIYMRWQGELVQVLPCMQQSLS